MYEIRKRSVFSKQSGYSFANRQYGFYRTQFPILASVLFLSIFLCFSHFPHQLRQLAVFPGHVTVVLRLMRQLTVRAVFNFLLGHSEIPATFISQCIQRTVAEQTVKVLRICACMARKLFTFLIAEKSIVFPFPIWFFHLLSPRYIKKSSHGTAELVIFETYFRGFAILLRGRQWIRSNMRRERMHPE